MFILRWFSLCPGWVKRKIVLSTLQTLMHAYLYLFFYSFPLPVPLGTASYIYMHFFLNRFRCGSFILWLSLRLIDFSSAEVPTACSKARQNGVILFSPWAMLWAEERAIGSSESSLYHLCLSVTCKFLGSTSSPCFFWLKSDLRNSLSLFKSVRML